MKLKLFMKPSNRNIYYHQKSPKGPQPLHLQVVTPVFLCVAGAAAIFAGVRLSGCVTSPPVITWL